jgi:NitT/TauT family transport system ATP-binding protein
LEKEGGVMGRTLISVNGLGKEFPRNGNPPIRVLEDLSLEIEERQILGVIGPSGCGKSTLLNIISGLIPATKGDVIRHFPFKIGYIFQDARLLPWRTILGNVSYGLEVDPDFSALRKKERREIARNYLSLVGLSGFEDRYPHEISGGMLQRVSLARGLAIDPALFLMDEPFGALDALTRRYLQEELIEIIMRTGKAVLLITHDIDEAILLGDSLIIMTACPGRVKEKRNIDIPRPRESSVFARERDVIELRAHILGLLQEEVAKVGGRQMVS